MKKIFLIIALLFGQFIFSQTLQIGTIQVNKGAKGDAGSGGAGTTIKDTLTASGGETFWKLSNTPNPGYIPQLFIGGLLQEYGETERYIISNDTVFFKTINNPLVAGDKLHIEYNNGNDPALGLQSSEINTFSKLNTIVADKTLVNLEDDQAFSGNISANSVKAGSLAGTGVAVTLDNALGTYYNMGAANAGTTYTTSSLAIGGYAKCLINTTSEPTVTGATKVAGATWVTGTNMYLVIYTDDATNVKYFFLEI